MNRVLKDLFNIGIRIFVLQELVLPGFNSILTVTKHLTA